MAKDLRDTPFIRAYQEATFWGLCVLFAASTVVGVAGLPGPFVRFLLRDQSLNWAELKGSLVVILVSLVGWLSAIAVRRANRRRACALSGS